VRRRLATARRDVAVKEACGVVAVSAPGREVSHLVFDALYALQHRGQESAGMASANLETVTVVKDMGLVATVFNERSLAALDGDQIIGHTRYSTQGESAWHAAQPVFRSQGDFGFALAHNGNLTNTVQLAERAGTLPGILNTDTDVVAELLATSMLEGRTLTEAMGEVLPLVEGAYSFVLVEATRVHGIRDAHGFRPLCLGRFGGVDAPEGWALASESPALDVMGATFVREVVPGELVTIEGTTCTSIQLLEPADPARLCIFEFVYFARPDAVLEGREVHGARRRMGELLARQSPVDADLVMGVPDSGVPAAEGYALASGIPFGQGLVKNRYIGRTFIAPDQVARARGVRRKLNPLREHISGKRLIVVDDSIVRGTTTRAIVTMLRDAGATEVHLRISSPPFRWPCFYGIDTPTRDELLASHRSIDEIREFLLCDSIDYISLDHLVEAIDAPTAGFCDACLTGRYPTRVPLEVRGATGVGA
jgi:amidophosphoribosyltransferase